MRGGRGARRLVECEGIENIPADGDFWLGAQARLEEVRKRREEARAKRALARPPAKGARPRPPPEVKRFRVEENPFGRFTAAGGRRHAGRFSFRAVTEGEVYHWDFVVDTLVRSLAQCGLDFREAHGSWVDVQNGADPAMFTCSCGDPRCGGFGDQGCVFGEETVLWRVEYVNAIVELEFDRVRYECWALSMLWRMRGSARLRRDPWQSLKDKGEFDAAVAAMLDARPDLLAIWEMFRRKRRLDEADFARIREDRARIHC